MLVILTYLEVEQINNRIMKLNDMYDKLYNQCIQHVVKYCKVYKTSAVKWELQVKAVKAQAFLSTVRIISSQSPL